MRRVSGYLVAAGLTSVLAASACGGASDSGLKGGGEDGGAGTAGVGGGSGGSGGDGGSGASAGSGGSGGGTVSCVSDKDCTPMGMLCDKDLGFCVQCRNTEDCDDGQLCAGFRCIDAQACDNSLECDGGQVCHPVEKVCVECAGDNDCPDGDRCIAFSCQTPGGTGGSGGGTGGSGGGTGGSGGGGGCDPGAWDIPGDGDDQDCSGVADDEPSDCDGGFAIDDADPLNAARAIGLCRRTQSGSWGVVSAKYVKADGTDGMAPLSHGILPRFGAGTEPREGSRIAVLSSGTARRPVDPGYESPSGKNMGTTSGVPAGHPLPADNCSSSGTVTMANDPAALELVLRVPTNAQGYAFDFNYFTFEFPNFVCADFADVFVALANPAPNGARASSVTFADDGPISANTKLLRVCQPQLAGGIQFDCPLTAAPLIGSGFELSSQGTAEPHAATGWLTTRAPVQPGSEVTIRFAIWDVSDHVLDSTVVLDNFRWLRNAPNSPTTGPAQ